MDHRRQIAVILKQWLQMTRGESQAIRASDWAALRKVQGAKAELRQPLGRAFELWRAENPAEVASDPFRIEIAELLALEAHNSHVLATRKQRVHEKKRRLEQAQFNLRRVRSSYAPADRVVLSSYS
jgi:hypothetical protein